MFDPPEAWQETTALFEVQRIKVLPLKLMLVSSALISTLGWIGAGAGGGGGGGGGGG